MDNGNVLFRATHQDHLEVETRAGYGALLIKQSLLSGVDSAVL